MTPGDFVKQCDEYFGAWKRYTVRMSVESWARSKTPYMLDSMWAIVRDLRETSEGPPDIAFLMKYHDEAVRTAKREEKSALPPLPPDSPDRPKVTWEEIAKWPLIENAPGDRMLSRREAGEALALIMGKLAGKGKV